MTEETTQAVADEAAQDQEAVQPEKNTEQAETQKDDADTPADDEDQETDDSAPSDEDSGDDATDESKPKKKGDGIQKRFDQLTRENYLAKDQVKKLEARLKELEQSKQQPQQQRQGQQAQQLQGGEPALEDFNTVEEFVQAHRDWAMDQGKKVGQQELQTQFQQQQEQARIQQIRQQLEAREASTRAKHKDYDEIVRPFGPVLMGNQTLAEYIATEEMGPEVAYHLARNPAILDQLNGLSEYQAGRKLLELEARLKSPPPAKTITKAPDPIKTVGGRETVTKTLADLAKEQDIGGYVNLKNKKGKPA